MSVILGIVLLGIIVFLHELGHFTASKFCGVKVESFSIGMGPILVHKTIYGTDWRISALPFGGYCGMKGEKDFDSDFSLKDSDSFYGKKPIFRAIIGIAGPVANFLFAIIAFATVSMVGYSYYSTEPKIQIATEVFPEVHSAAFESGIRTGDLILKINNENIKEFSDIPKIVSSHPDEDLIIQVERKKENSSEILDFEVHTDFSENDDKKIGKIGVVSMKVQSKKLGLFSALLYGAKEAFSTTKIYVQGIISLFGENRESFSESVSGPARITTMLGDSAKYGFSSVMFLVAIINISLFFMNLLPIPILDGWLILISLIEAIFKIKISKKIRTIAQIIGISLVILLFLIATVSDIKYFVGLFHV